MAGSRSIQMFLQLLATYIAKDFPEDIDPSLNPIDSANCIECRQAKYDFIIVGAGSAGSVLARRLSENPNWNILLIEAGSQQNYLTETPGLWLQLPHREFIWNYTTVRQERACLNMGGVCQYPRGRVMGGSSAINAMLYVRGTPEDYDEWEQMGNPGWGYKDVLKYFLKLENMTIPELANSPYHSTKGPLTVSYPKYRAPVFNDIYQAGIDSGYKAIDYNGGSTVGVGFAQTTTDGVTRASTSKCYLDPIRHRRNLRIFMNTVVTKVLIDETTRTAVGVRCLTSGKEYDVFVNKEVILSAGALNTPKVLMLSGIGPKEQLEEKGLPVIANLPVGENLQDHAGFAINFRQKEFDEECTKEFGDEVASDYAKKREGVLTSNQLVLFGYPNNTKSPDLAPDLQFTFGEGNYIFRFVPGACLSVVIINIDPKSRGTLKLKSTDIFDQPLIDPKYFEVEDDLQVAIKGYYEAVKYLKSPILSKYGFTLIADKPCNSIKDETEFIKCLISHGTSGIYHCGSSTKMGSINDKTTVVSPELKVHTIKNLRVADAGVMPKVTRGNTNVPTIMIAEKASDMIKAAHGCDS